MHKVNVKRLKRGVKSTGVFAAFYSREQGIILDCEEVLFPLSDAVWAAMQLSMGYGAKTPADIWVAWDSKTMRVFSLVGDFIDADILSKIEALIIGSCSGDWGVVVSIEGVTHG